MGAVDISWNAVLDSGTTPARVVVTKGSQLTQPMSQLLGGLELEQIGEGRYRAQNVAPARGARAVIFGGQLLGQSIVAATLDQPGKVVKTIHTIFARGGDASQPVEIDVDRMHAGRSFGSVTVTVRQGERLCTRSLLLLHEPEPDIIRHAVAMPDVDGPEKTVLRDYEFDGYQFGFVGGIDVSDPTLVAPAELGVWVRFAGTPDDVTTSQALLAYASDGFLIGTAMLPHEGISQAQAHQGISTGVITHTVTFHEPFRASDWLLLMHDSPYAGRGRSYGHANVFQNGQLVASFVQDNMIRSAEGGRPSVL